MGAFVTVYNTDDPLHGGLLVDVLTDGGIRARLLGTQNAALIGVGQSILTLKIEVPAADESRARELLDGFLHAEPASDHDPEVREAGASEARRRSAVLAAGACFVLPGGGHLYAHRPWTGLVLFLGLAASFVGMVAGRDVESTCAALVFGGLVVADLVGGHRAVRAHNRGERRGVGRQLVAGLLLLLVAAGAGVAIGTHLPPPRRATH